MYTEFYGLRELPFELSPNPRYLLLTPRHREALANMQYGISARKSLTLLTGEAGTGKTTLILTALASESCRGTKIVHLANPTLTRQEFVEFLAGAFGLSEHASQSKAALLTELHQELVSRRAAGVNTALVIDEAQCLEPELLNEIRLLSNIETPSEKLLPLVLVGQPEFADRLNLPSMTQLKQRVALRCSLGLLDETETFTYVEGRIRIAGGDAWTIFTRDAVAIVHRAAAGIPRTISVICDNALVSGFAGGLRLIGPEVIHDVCKDFDLKTFNAKRAQVEKAPASGTPGEPSAQPGDVPLFSNFGRKRGFSFF
jgi:general secretion pathway protein A